MILPTVKSTARSARWSRTNSAGITTLGAKHRRSSSGEFAMSQRIDVESSPHLHNQGEESTSDAPAHGEVTAVDLRMPAPPPDRSGHLTPPPSRLLSPDMRTTRTRPALLCVPGLAAADPVRMNCPGGAPASTARRTTSQASGNCCHSSMSTGEDDSSRSGAAAMISRTAGFSRRYSTAARSAPVALFPTALAPTSATAGAPANNSSSCRPTASMSHPLS